MPRLFDNELRALDDNGDPSSGALFYFYEAGTTTPVTTYSDVELTIAQSNPVVADAAGYAADPYVREGNYKVICRTAGGATLFEVDNVEIKSQAIYPAILMIGAGQSNMASSNAQASGGDLTADSRIVLWTGAAWETWTPGSGMGVGASGRNSILFQAAKEAIRKGHAKVYCVNDAHAGQAISYWTGSGTSSAGYVSLKAKMDAAFASAAISAEGITAPFGMIWGQGESDGGASFDVDTYAASFATLKTQLRAESWFATDTPITCLEMPSLASAQVVNRFFLSLLPFDADPYTSTTKTEALDDGADNLHWTGAAMNQIGQRAFKMLANYIQPALPPQNVIDAKAVHLRLENTFGKGFGFTRGATGDTNDQIFMGATSDASFPVNAVAAFTIDIDDAWVRLDTYAYALKYFEALEGIVLKSYPAPDFSDITSDVNTNASKKAGALFRDNTNDRLVMANDAGASGTWSYFEPAGTYTPV